MDTFLVLSITFFMLLLSSTDFFQMNFFIKFFQDHYQGGKQILDPDLG